MEAVAAVAEMSAEDARTRWDTITMNLAYLLASIVRVPESVGGLTMAQVHSSAEWLREQIDNAGGQSAIADVCKYVYSLCAQRK